MFAMWIQSKNRTHLRNALLKEQNPKHWTNPLNRKICDYEAANKKDFDLHYHCEECQGDKKKGPYGSA